MAHNLYQDKWTGQTAMMYTGEPPWHGLGTRLSGPVTSAEAIQAAGLDWEVEKVQLYMPDKNGKNQTCVPGVFGMVRTDLRARGLESFLGVVGETYTSLQNREAFQFFDGIVGEGEAVYHTAGVLGKGERVWILAKLPGTIRVTGDDIAEKYLLLSNGHDGKSSVQVKFTPVRVVCQNTLTLALAEGPTVRVAHLPSLSDRLWEATRLLGIIKDRYNKLENVFQTMTRIKLTEQRLKDYLEQIFPDPRDPSDKSGLNRARDICVKAAGLYETGYGNRMPGVTGTLWAAYNGVTQLVDHSQDHRNGDRMLEAIWFGDGYLTKARAFRVAQEKLKSTGILKVA